MFYFFSFFERNVKTVTGMICSTFSSHSWYSVLTRNIQWRPSKGAGTQEQKKYSPLIHIQSRSINRYANRFKNRNDLYFCFVFFRKFFWKIVIFVTIYSVTIYRSRVYPLKRFFGRLSS